MEIYYGHYSVGKEIAVSPDGDGWFIELAEPMPVGTTLRLVGLDGSDKLVRVQSVAEGTKKGMYVRLNQATDSSDEPEGKKKKKRR